MKETGRGGNEEPPISENETFEADRVRKRRKMADRTSLPMIPLLTTENYFNWRVKMESILQLKRLSIALTNIRPQGDVKKEEEWDEKNADAVA